MSPIGSIMENAWDTAVGVYEDVDDRINNPQRNGWNAPENNTMSDETKEKVAEEIGEIAGKELAGGSLKTYGARIGGPFGTLLDMLGDAMLEDANQKKSEWGYK